MSCSLLDIACHVQSAAYEWWVDISLLNKVLIVAGLVGLIVSLSWSLLQVVKRLGGWPAVVSVLALIVGVVLAILPRKPKGSDAHETLPDGHPDTKGPFEFGAKKTRPKVLVPKKRPKGETAADRWGP